MTEMRIKSSMKMRNNTRFRDQNNKLAETKVASRERRTATENVPTSVAPLVEVEVGWGGDVFPPPSVPVPVNVPARAVVVLVLVLTVWRIKSKVEPI